MKHFRPYLFFNGNCEEALNFYKECFNGEITDIGRYGDSPMPVPDSNKNKIIHAEFKFWGGSIMMSDQMESTSDASEIESTRIQLSLEFEDADKMQATFDKLKQDGSVTMELKEQFWGDKFGMMTDKYGIKWMFNCPKKGSVK